VLFNPLNAELNPICHLLEILGAHHILHVSKVRVKKGVFKIKLYTYNADFGKTKGKIKYKLLFRQRISGFFFVFSRPVRHRFPGYASYVICKAICLVLRFFGRRFEMILLLRAVDILVFPVKSQ